MIISNKKLKVEFFKEPEYVKERSTELENILQEFISFFSLEKVNIEASFCTSKEIQKINGGRAHFWNENAADKEVMSKRIEEIASITNNQSIKLLMHSIAFGSTTNFFEPTPVRQRQMDMTQHVMAHCLIYWTQILLEHNLLSKGSRILGLTSEGSYKAMEGYGPVGVAKASLEAVVRQIGWELGSQGITANTIQAGITPTRALTKISDNWEEWVEKTVERNPMGRTTTPEDVAGLVSLLLSDKADFVNCSTIFCDGGEHRSL